MSLLANTLTNEFNGCFLEEQDVGTFLTVLGALGCLSAHSDAAYAFLVQGAALIEGKTGADAKVWL